MSRSVSYHRSSIMRTHIRWIDGASEKDALMPAVCINVIKYKHSSALPIRTYTQGIVPHTQGFLSTAQPSLSRTPALLRAPTFLSISKLCSKYIHQYVRTLVHTDIACVCLYSPTNPACGWVCMYIWCMLVCVTQLTTVINNGGPSPITQRARVRVF